MEVELKLLIAEQDAETLLRHPLLTQYAMSDAQQLALSDIYFDTPDLLIRRSEAGLRVRNIGDAWVQTMKGGGSAHGGLHSRHEWASPVAGPAPDLAALRRLVGRKTAWHGLLGSPLLQDSLAPIFTARVRRTVWQLHTAQGDAIECALDQGQIECGDKSAAISEIELELKSGQPVSLFDLALALQQDIPMQTGNLSKAERGYAMFAPQPPAVLKAAPLSLSRRMESEQVFLAIAGNCLEQIQGNQTGVAAGDDAESVHQMRVGLRRLRSALGMFRGLLRLPDDLQQELDWLSAELGAARDWDVLAGSTLAALAETLPDADQIAELVRAAQEKRRAKHAAAAFAAASQRYTRLILSFARWTQGRGWRDGMAMRERHRLQQPVPGFAKRTLKKNQRRLLKRGKRLPGAQPEERHKVRIAAKKTRYAMEFFASLYALKKVRPYVKALSALQDQLGWLNDVAVAGRLLEELQQRRPLPEGPSQLPGQAGFARGYLAARAMYDARKMIRAWKKFLGKKLPV